VAHFIHYLQFHVVGAASFATSFRSLGMATNSTRTGADSFRQCTPPPRFGSYIGIVYVIAILSILGFAVFYDVGPGQPFDRLQTGMTPKDVGGILGVPKTEAKTGTELVQTWQFPDGSTFEVKFHGGRLATKERRTRADRVR
jgi:hypothetical protein